MEATIEISMYPLKEGYIEPIDDFIAHVKAFQDLTVRVNETSTHLFGDYDVIFEAIKSGISRSFETHGKSVFVLKVLFGDLSSSS